MSDCSEPQATLTADLLWEPEVLPLPVDWNLLKALWDEWGHLSTRAREAGAQSIDYDDAVAVERAQAVQDAAKKSEERCMNAAFAMLGHGKRPGIGLMKNLRWREELWYRMHGWEFWNWYIRLHDRIGWNTSNKEFRGQLRMLLTTDEEDHPPRDTYYEDGYLWYEVGRVRLDSSGVDAFEDGEIAWLWQQLKGKRFTEEDWRRFCGYSGVA